MAVVNGTNAGFVTTVPTADPEGNSATSINDFVIAIKATAPLGCYTVTQVGWYTGNTTPAANFQIGLYSHNAGSNIPNALLYSELTNAKGTTVGWKNVTVSWAVTPGTVYWLAVSVEDTSSHYIDVSTTDTGSRFALTWPYGLTDPWVDHNETDNQSPAIYAYYSQESTPSDKIYSKSLVAISNYEVWYESSAGTMEELTAANGDIDTTQPFEAVTAYEKIFIANGSNKKIIDRVNTKITTTDAGANPCTRGMTLTGGTSGASMRVDYVDGVTDDAAANVYGKLTTAANFSSGETVTGTNGDGNAVSFVTSAAGVDEPHWYNWTVFGNDTTTYGTMLSSPTLVCLYRGRLVIAGDNDYPQAWQMTKIGDPFKVLYDYTNDGDLSGVAYSNNKVGVIGDIIVSLTAYKDDLIIFGCANSIWGLVGDPLAEGQLAEITGDTGIWGSRAWCMDGQRNFYFLGNDGIYKMPISDSFTPPENISNIKLPNLIKDWDLDKSLHRIVLSYDPVNKGIIVSKTLLSDGTNSNYWFDLTTNGFFSESYPTSCGVFSSYYYPATDETYKKFLIGCTDGYIREFDLTTKDDATTSSTSAIDSYCAIVQPLGQDEDSEGMLRELTGILAGGASDGDFTDSDGVTCSIYKGDDAETVLEDIIDGATAFTSVTWSSTGKSNKSRPRMRGTWAGLKLRNNTASQSWAMEKLYGNVIPNKGKR